MTTDHWHFIGDAVSIKKNKLHRSWIQDQPLIVFWDDNTLKAYWDRCPHRSFPLSAGQLHCKKNKTTLTCSYHGWKFDADGKLIDRPGFNEESSPNYTLNKLNLKVLSGLVFVQTVNFQSDSIPTWMNDLEDPSKDSFYFITEIDAEKIHVFENLLDPLHTHFVHAPYLRSNETRVAVNVKANFRSREKTLEVEYTNEPTPTGWISRLFENKRTKTVGKYFHPNTAVLEYWSTQGLDLRVTMILSENKKNLLQGTVVFQTSKTKVPYFLKKPFFKFFTGILLKQDFKALKLQNDNLKYFKDPHWVSKEDVVFKTIRQLSNNENLEDFEKSYVFML
jgi:phenylpropionate dioxygenase-like ring-hydroxylating dioxygenase large terminal subunit